MTLELWLIDKGWNADDMREVAIAYDLYGIDSAVDVISDKDDETHDYTGELRGHIEEWEKRQDLRRERMYLIGEESILQVFNAWLGLPQCVRIPRIPGIPEGARFTGAWYSYIRRAWELRVWHESFDIVPDGEQIPSAFDGWEVEWETFSYTLQGKELEAPCSPSVT